MGNQFAAGKKAFGFCDVCGFRFDLKRLKNLTVKTKRTETKACEQCWTPDQPQLQLGMFPVYDPQALRNPRPDLTYQQSGTTSTGSLGEGSRIIQWGWNPVGGGRAYDSVLTPNDLVGVGQIGTVTVTTASMIVTWRNNSSTLIPWTNSSSDTTDWTQ